MKRVKNDDVKRKCQQEMYKKSESSGRMRDSCLFFSVLFFFLLIKPFLSLSLSKRWERINRRVDEAGNGARTIDERRQEGIKVVAGQENRRRRGIETKFSASTSRSSSW